jgi:raffinose/stachyose/melibiose transport system substrate-binding protein
MGAVLMWYNKELFAKAGISNPPETWSEFLNAVKKLKAAGIIPIALGEGDKWPGHFWWVYLAIRLGGKEAFDKAYSRKGSFTDEPFIEAGKKLKELIDLEPFQKGFLAANFGDEGALMGNGLAGMELMGQWAKYNQENNSETKKGIGENLGTFAFPMVDGGAGNKNDIMGGGNGSVIGKGAPDEAVDFLRYITSVDINTRMAKTNQIIPVVKGAESVLTDPHQRKIQQMVADADYYQLYYDQYLPPAVGEVIKEAVQMLFSGKISPEETAQRIEDTMKEEF